MESLVLFDPEQLKKQIDNVFQPIIDVVANTVYARNPQIALFFRRIDLFLNAPDSNMEYRTDAINYIKGFLKLNDSEDKTEKKIPLQFNPDIMNESDKEDFYSRLRILFQMFFSSFEDRHLKAVMEDNLLLFSPELVALKPYVYIPKPDVNPVTNRNDVDSRISCNNLQPCMEVGKPYVPDVFAELIEVFEDKLSSLCWYYGSSRNKVKSAEDAIESVHDFIETDNFFEKMVEKTGKGEIIKKQLLSCSVFHSSFWRTFAVYLIVKIINYPLNNYSVLWCLYKLYLYIEKKFFGERFDFWNSKLDKNTDYMNSYLFFFLDDKAAVNDGMTVKPTVKIERLDLEEILHRYTLRKDFLIFCNFIAVKNDEPVLNGFNNNYSLIQNIFEDNKRYHQLFSCDHEDELSINAIKNYFSKCLIEIFFSFNLNLEKQQNYSDSDTFNQMDQTQVEGVILKFILQNSALTEPCKFFISAETLKFISNEAFYKQYGLKDKNSLSIGFSSRYDVIFLKFNQMTIIVWVERSSMFIAALDNSLLNDIVVHLYGMSGFSENFANVFSELDYSCILRLEYIDDIKMIKYLKERNVATRFSFENVFPDYYDEDINGSSLCRDSTDRLIPKNLLKLFSSWLRSHYTAGYFVYSDSDYSRVETQRQNSCCELVYVKRMNTPYTVKKTKSGILYRVRVSLQGLNAGLFRIGNIIVKKNCDDPLSFSELTDSLKKKYLSISFLSDDVHLCFSIFIFVSVPGVFNLHHCIEYLCYPSSTNNISFLFDDQDDCSGIDNTSYSKDGNQGDLTNSLEESAGSYD